MVSANGRCRDGRKGLADVEKRERAKPRGSMTRNSGRQYLALVSGGLDSCVMLREIGSRSRRVFPVYVRAGLRWERVEILWLKRFLAASRIANCEPLTVLDFPAGDLYGDHWSTTGRDVPGFHTALDSNYLPGRNLLLLSKASVFCALRGIDRIALAPLANNPFPDGTMAFFRSFAKLAKRALSVDLRIELPYRDLQKAEVIRRGADLPLELTFSCIQPMGLQHCGNCTKCAERQRGFTEANVPDPTTYRRVNRSTRLRSRHAAVWKRHSPEAL